MTGEVVGHELGVAANPVDAVAVAGVLEVLTEHVETGQGGDAASLLDLTELIQHG